MPDVDASDILAEHMSVCDSMSNHLPPTVTARSVLSALASTFSNEPTGHSPSIMTSASLSSTYV